MKKFSDLSVLLMKNGKEGLIQFRRICQLVSFLNLFLFVVCACVCVCVCVCGVCVCVCGAHGVCGWVGIELVIAGL